MNKTIFLIGANCNNYEKLSVLESNIKFIKKCGFDTAVVSSIPIPELIQEISDYTYKTKENPSIDWPDRAINYWTNVLIGNEMYQISNTVKDYGYAVLLKFKRVLQIFKNYDYENYVYIDYDSVLTETHIKELINQENGKMFPSQRGDTIWDVGLHLLLLKKEHIDSFVEDINKQFYLSYCDINKNLFDYIKEKGNENEFSISTLPVYDKIYEYENVDIHNFSEIENIKFHIARRRNDEDSVKITIYDIKDEFKVKVILNEENVFSNIVNKPIIIDLKKGYSDINKLKIIINGEENNLTEKLKSIGMSDLVKLV